MKAIHGFFVGMAVVLGAHDMIKWRLKLLEAWLFPIMISFGPTRRVLMSATPALVVHDERDPSGLEEFVSGMWVKHEYIQTNRTFHLVKAECSGIPLVFLHGHMQSWYSFSLIMAALQQRGYCTYAFDLLGYGQSDHDQEVYGWKEQAEAFAQVFKSDPRFKKVFLISHDRGSIVADHLTALQDGFEIVGYARCQQAFLLPHALPRPPRAALGDAVVGVDLSTRAGFILGPPFLSNGPHPNFNATRFRREYSFKGMWYSTTLAYSTNTIVSEWNDLCFEEGHAHRLPSSNGGLDFYHTYRGNYDAFGFKSFRNASLMNCHPDQGGLVAHIAQIPTLVIQGALDAGMPPWTYYHIPDVLPNVQVRFFNAGWFCIVEIPDDIAAAIHTFIQDHVTLATLF